MDNEIFLMIDSYIDGELNRKDEDMLFEQLAINSDARDYFRRVNLIRSQTKSLTDEFPAELEGNITRKVFASGSVRRSFSQRAAGYAAAAISFVLLLISLLLLNEVSGYRQEINSAVNQLNKQNTIIEALYNSLPAAEVQAKYSNEIIIKPKI